MLISAPSNCPLATEKVLYIYIYTLKREWIQTSKGRGFRAVGQREALQALGNPCVPMFSFFLKFLHSVHTGLFCEGCFEYISLTLGVFFCHGLGLPVFSLFPAVGRAYFSRSRACVDPAWNKHATVIDDVGCDELLFEGHQDLLKYWASSRNDRP